MAQRRGGILSAKIDGVPWEAKGNFTINYGRPLREPIIGADGIHGFKETPQVASIEGVFTDSISSDLNTLFSVNNVTFTLELGNGKTIVLRDAYFSGEGNVTTEEGEIAVMFASEFPIEEF